jgi:hypothetical protein
MELFLFGFFIFLIVVFAVVHLIVDIISFLWVWSIPILLFLIFVL